MILAGGMSGHLIAGQMSAQSASSKPSRKTAGMIGDFAKADTVGAPDDCRAFRYGCSGIGEELPYAGRAGKIGIGHHQ